MLLRMKLLLGFICVSLIAAIIGAVGIFGLNAVKAADKNMWDNGTSALPMVMDLANALDQVKVAIRDAALSTSAVGNQAAQSEHEMGVNAFLKAMKDYSSTFIDDQDRANFAKLSSVWDDEYLPETKKVLDLALAKKSGEAAAELQSPTFEKIKNDINGALKTLTDYNLVFIKKINANNTQLTQSTTIILIAVVAAGILVAVVLGLQLTRSIVRQLGGEPAQIADIADRVAAGDYDIDLSDMDKATGIYRAILNMTGNVQKNVGGEPTMIAGIAERVATGDYGIDLGDRDKATGIYRAILDMTAKLLEIAGIADRVAKGDLDIDDSCKGDARGIHRAILNMTGKLREIVTSVQAAATQVAAGSQQISSTAQQMSQGSTEQAANAEEVSSSIEEMTATIRQNSDNSLATEKIAQKASVDGEEGGQAVVASVSAMREISDKVVVIEEIARQTNLLALTRLSRPPGPAKLAGASP